MTSEGYPGWSYPKPLICTTIRKPDGDIQHYIQHIITDRAVVVTANIEKPKFVTTVVTLVHRNMPVCGAICLRYPVRITCYMIFNILERCLSIIWSDGNESSCVVRYLGYSRMCLWLFCLICVNHRVISGIFISRTCLIVRAEPA